MIPYIGGKSQLAKWIIAQFPPEYQSLTYVEVFGGGGWVLFKKEGSNLEVYNDLNSQLVNLFTVIRDQYPDFSHLCQWTLHSREMYLEAHKKVKENKFNSDIEKALQYAIRRVQSFSGSGGWGYAVQVHKPVSGMWLPFLRRLQLINARLKRTQIECLDFENCIKKYDSPNAFFYLDPPYVNAEKYYNAPGVSFTLEDHKRLAALLNNLQGKFILSYYDDPLIRELYSGHRMLEKSGVKSSRGMTKQSCKKPRPVSKELLILNY